MLLCVRPRQVSDFPLTYIHQSIVRCFFSFSDGLISYDELLSYFQSANSQLRERFTHLFVEHTFIGTTVCEHCKGMVRKSVNNSPLQFHPLINYSVWCGTDERHSEARSALQGLWDKLPQTLQGPCCGRLQQKERKEKQVLSPIIITSL